MLQIFKGKVLDLVSQKESAGL